MAFAAASWLLSKDGRHDRMVNVVFGALVRQVRASGCNCAQCALIRRMDDDVRAARPDSLRNQRAWWYAARQAIRDVADEATTFTSDDVWAVLYERDVDDPHDARVMSAAFAAAARDGEIERDEANEQGGQRAWRKKSS